MKFLDLIDGAAPAWHAKALCHPDYGHDPEIWFPEGRGGQTREAAIERAVAICRQCPVRTNCLADADEHRDNSGVWGGTDFEGAPKLGPAACGTESGYAKHRRLKEPTCAECRKAHATAVARRYLHSKTTNKENQNVA